MLGVFAICPFQIISIYCIIAYFLADENNEYIVIPVVNIIKQLDKKNFHKFILEF